MSVPIGLEHVGGAKLTHALSCDAWLYRGKGVNLLFEPGLKEGLPALRQHLGARGLKLSDLDMIIGLHEHIDHVGAVPDIQQEAPDVPFYAGAEAVPALLTGDYYETCGFFYGQTWGGVESVEPVTEEMELNAGDATLIFHETPGHSQGSIAVEQMCPGGRILHTSDTLFGDHFDETMADLDLRRQSLSCLRKLVVQHRIQYLTVGHADPPQSLVTDPLEAIDAAIDELPTTRKPWRRYYTAADMAAGHVQLDE